MKPLAWLAAVTRVNSSCETDAWCVVTGSIVSEGINEEDLDVAGYSAFPGCACMKTGVAGISVFHREVA